MAEHNDPELGFGDYMRVLKRRARLLLVIVGVTLLIGVVIAYRLPPLYASTGVLLAEQPEVPEHVVRSTVPDYPEERVRIITQRVLTNENLSNIIAERGLYRESAEGDGEAIRTFRDHLALSSEDPEMLENIMGTRQAATAVAFSLTFAHPSPILARDVTRDLVSLYLEANQRARQEQAADTTEFLTREAQRLDAEIAEREERLAEFKRQNAGSLPEVADMNMQLLDRAERDLQQVEQDIRTLREQRTLYSSELAQLSPHATIVNEEGAPVLSSQDRLKLLQRRYVQLTAIYSADHPDVAAVRREIDALSASTGLPGFDRATLQSELVAREEQLAAARDRYSPDHPDVLRLERTVQGLRDAAAQAPSAPRRSSSAPPDNPQYIQRQVQLQATDAELNAAYARRDDLAARLADLEGRLTTTPAVEREYSALTRGYEQLVAQYGEIELKLREAQLALNLESEARGERFTVLQTPGLPSSPSSPNRLAVLLLTLVVAGIVGACAVAIAERSDTTVRGPKDISKYLEIPPLVAIPFVYNPADRRRRLQRRLVDATAVCLWAAMTAFFVLTPAG